MNNNQSSQDKPVFGPYSPVRSAGGLYFVSGQVGIDPATKTASNDVSVQTKQALDNLANVLKDVGLSLNDVLKTTIFLADITDFAAVNEVYMRYFTEPRPARSTVAVKELPRLGGDVPIKIEIEAVVAERQEP